MAETITLEATRRDVIGKHVRKLRAEGIIPGVLYGPTFEPIALQMAWTDLRPALLQAGGSQLIKLNIDGEAYDTLVRRVDRSPIRGDVLHVDFYRVRMDVVIRTEIRIVLTGNVHALETFGASLNQEMNSIEIECLPGNLPAEVLVDVSGITQVGNMILVSDLPALPGVTYLQDPQAVVVTTAYMERAEEAGEEEEERGEFESEAEPELIRRREEEFEEE